MHSNKTTIVVSGSIAFDHIMNFKGKFADYIMPDQIHKLNVSFLMDTVKKEFGGTGGNQAYSLALLGERPYLLTTAGNDFASYNTYLQKVGVNTDLVEIQRSMPCAVGFAMTDLNDNQIWGFGSAASGEITKYKPDYFLRTFTDKENLFVMLAPQHQDAMIRWARYCRTNNIRHMFDPAFQIPQISNTLLEQAIAGAELLFGNDYELALISSKLKLSTLFALRRKNTKTKVVVKTLGPKGSIVYDLMRRKKYRIPAVHIAKIVDPTGAGDAYRSGFIIGYLHHRSLPQCGCMGSVAASYAVEHYGTINHTFTRARYNKRLEDNYTDMVKSNPKTNHEL
ncbi:carbohydrate kinase family protein [Candidatus Roizmanbacteria bacterium CG10_big_fil_rev_8_21_14_0_10_39_6]|uniref:Carbohydrate kinase family protein n=1 Tax=Candidatus Roizmanbacteria bacterium CG10_big_fil_rev_8_21_14_0_10_39_6 TaxID=1974853 RepID=A0A2M8KSV4_9BACT|nr:MAG: carbohydrate kinase family protein [Candidatus Roizmanbacteria bacterium CG10_big_fil_rev_8_21_14_0_10_39_6]